MSDVAPANETKPTRLRFDLVVFDLDGTLVDSLQDLTESVNSTLRGFGAEALPASRVQEFVGNGAPQLIMKSTTAAGIPGLYQEALVRFLAHYQEQCSRNTALYPGIRKLLERLQRQTTLAILTNKPAASTGRILDFLKAGPFFAAVAGGDTYPTLKPDPLGLTSLIRHFSVRPTRTLMVGDSEVDMETGRRAGAVTCCAGWGMKSAEVRTADFTVLEPRELEPVVLESGSGN